MTTEEARELIQGAVLDDDGAPTGPVWADLGAGSGTFSFALAELLGSDGRVIAVDRETAAVASLRRGIEGRAGDEAGGGHGASAGTAGRVQPVEADFREPSTIGELAAAPIHGALFANALHFDPDPERTLERTGALLAPGGRLVVVEYQDRPPNPWVPHPLPVARLEEVAAALGVAAPRVVGERPSSYGGVLYCAWLEAS